MPKKQVITAESSALTKRQIVASCISEYGVELAESAVPFVPAFDLAEAKQTPGHSITPQEVAAIGAALFALLRPELGAAATSRQSWALQARSESIQGRF